MQPAANQQRTVDRAVHRAMVVARAVVPELADGPLYIVPVGDDSGPVTRQHLHGCDAFWGSMLDVTLQPEIEARGEWQGRGPAMVVDTAAAVDSFDDCEVERRLVGIVLHELAHYLDHPEPPSVAPVATDTLRENVDVRCEVLKRPADPTPAIDACFLGHYTPWQRIAVHLWWRCNHGGGVILRPDHLAIGNSYQTLEHLPSPAALVDGLADECRRLRDLPLRHLADIPVPDAFDLLWRDTLKTVFSRSA